MAMQKSLLGASLAALSLSSFVSAQAPAPPPVTLVPISQPAPVADPSLQSSETFNFGANTPAQDLTASITMAYDQAPTRNVLSLDKFSSSLASVDCDESMNFVFNDQPSYDAAKTAWNWVNSAPENGFVMVANDPRCSEAQRFGLWLVSSVAFEDAGLAISGTATQTNWQASADSGEAGVKISSRESVASKRARRWGLAPRQDGERTLDLNSDFTGLIADSAFIGIVQPSVALDCVDCRTTGILDFDFEGGGLFGITAVKTRIFPRDVSANVELGLTIGGNLTDPKTFTKELFTAPLAGFDIPGIATLGASLTIDAGAEFTVTGEATLKFGANVVVPNDSVAGFEVGLGGFDDDENEVTGWQATTTPIGPELSAQIDATASIFTSVGVKLEASILSFGLEASLDLRAPEFTATASALADTAGVCDSNQGLGVQLKVDAGINLVFSAGLADSDPVFSPTLFEVSTPLFEQCLPFGPEIGAEEAPAEEAPPAEEASPAEEAPADAGACSGETRKVADGDNCDTISSGAGISREEFLAANPSVNAECTNLILDTDICVPAPAAPPAEAAPAEGEAAPAEGGCSGETRKVGDGETCQTVADGAGIALADFLAANPQIDAECTNLQLDADICVPGAPHRRLRRHARQLF